MSSSTSILSLPQEIIESILTFSAAADDACAIASLAQACRQLRSVVYDPEDRHLWRVIFCAAFDDPRSVHRDLSAFDWHQAFTERVWARRYIHRHARPLQVPKKPHLRSTRATLLPIDQLSDEHTSTAHLNNLRALNAVVHAICTAAPRPPLPPRVGTARTDSHDLPPLTELHAHTPRFPPPLPQHLSLNVEWLRRTLSDGLPYAVIGLLSNEFAEISWRHLPEAQSLGQLTSYLGFIPVPVIESHSPPVSPNSSRRNRGKSTTQDHAETIDMSESAQRERARNCARPLAFQMRYLSRRRNWGPYLPWPPKAPKPAVVPSVDDYTADDDDDDMDSDEDYMPPDDGDTTPSATPEPPDGPTLPPGAVPPPQHLYPDWTWLAAARVVAECKLRAHVDATDVAQLEAWDNLRAGAWGPASDTGRDRSMEAEADSRAEPLSGDEWKKHQRDWAGAEGAWRRLVCWLDYDDLIYHNSYGDFIDSTLDEAWIIVPLSLQITGYSAPSIAAYPDRPTIHVKGEMGGAGWVGSVEANDDDVRHCHGTVSMLPDGNVRWSITSTAPNSMQDEWASEAVQLGGVGSAMGSLGMWTGAFHEDGDPLGVMWQWRVG
ncbi:hypothetical protein OH76DRAFT_1413201 [Lentinus brumalis]|uniref:F-box domain-containing protein n=1 Tax=Lentinus brumalis TaxID=2498619 RepID=A0A371CIG5_9APHY|nr:hypothetical protein OH76DRAFT_1413201 [Polyporus brumalis]